MDLSKVIKKFHVLNEKLEYITDEKTRLIAYGNALMAAEIAEASEKDKYEKYDHYEGCDTYND